jgi:hypothetical protein
LNPFLALIVISAAAIATPFVGYAIADRLFTPKPKR